MFDKEKQSKNTYAKSSSYSSSTQLGSQLGHTHSVPTMPQCQIVIGGHQWRFGCLITCLCVCKANLDYSEEVHQSRFFGEWSDIIDYEMGSSLAKVYTTSKTSPIENFEHEWKYDMATNMATLFARGVLRMSSFLGNLKPLDKKLDIWKNCNLWH